MPTPNTVLKRSTHPIPTVAPPQKGGVEDLLSADLGDGEDIPALASPAARHVASLPAQVDQADEPGSDKAKVQALVNAAMKREPALAILVKSKGAVAKERVNLELGTVTEQRWRDLILARNEPPGNILANAVMPWIKANATPESLIYARDQVATSRQVGRSHAKAAMGGEGEVLRSGGDPIATHYPLASLASVKSLWSASGLAKKAFFEACIFLYLELNTSPKA